MKCQQYNNLDLYSFITTHLIHTLKPDALPLVCIKPDDPKKGGWIPTPLVPGTTLPAHSNLYICIASCNKLYEPGHKHHNQYRATIECASQVHMFMLDDLTKAEIRKLPIPPTWVIQSSPNNHQCLYTLTTPLSDIAYANKITKLLPGTVSSDKGAVNAVRWARLPGGINNKTTLKKPYTTKITEANPDLTYSTADIVAGFKLEINQSENTSATTDAPITSGGVEPTGWARHLSALLAIPANCDYTTWWNCIITMHAWGERGYAAIYEWSRTSTDKKHKELTDAALRNKFDSVPYDSRNNTGHSNVISWPWLQATATKHGWSYANYSQLRLIEIKTSLLKANTTQKIQNLIPEIKDAYFCGTDQEQILTALQAAFKTIGTDETLATIRRLVTQNNNLAPDDSQWTFPLTDKGNVERFGFLFKKKFHHIPETKQYIVWINDKWQYIREIQHLLFETIEKIPQLENRTLTSDQSKQLTKWQFICESNNRIRALETLVTKNLAFSKEIGELNTQKTLIGTPTTTFDLTTGLVGLNTPEHLITMTTGVDIIPDATCPRWDKFIMEIMNNDKQISRFIQKLSGYSLYGGNPEQLFVILEGHGANGKTTFVNVLQHIFGNYASTAAADTLTRPAFNKSGSAAAPDIVRLYRKRLVICNEWNEGTYINESLIKVLSGGGDEISVRALYSNKTIDYIPEFMIMLATNHRPNISGMDYGIWRRLIIIPFDINFTDAEHISEREPHLEGYLKTHEAHGIMNWLIEGYRMWQEEGMGTSIETGIPERLIKLKEQYKLEMDNIGQFLKEQTYFDEESTTDEYRTRTSDLYRAYNNWSIDNGYKAKGTKTFSQALIHRGYPRVTIGTSRGFKGVRLLTPSEMSNITNTTIN